MGWTNSHLHEFNDGNFRIGDTGEEACEFGNPPQWDEKDKKISDYFSKDKTKLSYAYDFGDNWEHTIILEGIEPVQKGLKYPRCIDGARACPPEDCGSTPGYYRLLEILADLKHEEYEEMKEWAGNFEPEHFYKIMLRYFCKHLFYYRTQWENSGPNNGVYFTSPPGNLFFMADRH